MATENAAARPVLSPVGRDSNPGGLSSTYGTFVDFAARERPFLILLAVLFGVAGAVYQTPYLAMWFGFAVAGYAVVANDSIQTIGTFIASNQKTRWWILWLFIGGIFLVTIAYSWFTYGGDVSYQRLASHGFADAPTSFSFLQVAAPIFLLILTRMRMPVSTTFLILSAFTTSAEGIGGVLVKSLAGYGVAFASAIVVYLAFSRIMKDRFQGEAGRGWVVAQWVISGALWAVWIMQDAANVAVFLPRSLSATEVIFFAGTIIVGLGILFFLRGEKIQKVVEEKSAITDVRAATVVDTVYVVILYVFKTLSHVPMSTTWVFLGLLAGREIGMRVRGTTDNDWGQTRKLIGRDVAAASIGLAVSLGIAVAVNPAIRQAILGF